MTKYYRIKRYAPGKVSIDQCSAEGVYVCQEAFFYRTFADAEREIPRLVAEDARHGVQSTRWIAPAVAKESLTKPIA